MQDPGGPQIQDDEICYLCDTQTPSDESPFPRVASCSLCRYVPCRAARAAGRPTGRPRVRDTFRFPFRGSQRSPVAAFRRLPAGSAPQI